MRGWLGQPLSASSGYSLVELLSVCVLLATLMGISVPQVLVALSQARALAAGRYLAGRMQAARVQAATGGAFAGLRVTVLDGEIAVGGFRDGNHNGIRAAEVASGVDPRTDAEVGLAELFPGVKVSTASGTEPTASGSPDITMFSFAPTGTASSGTVYLGAGGNGQYAVRVLGATGRVRLLRFRPATRDWIEVR